MSDEQEILQAGEGGRDDLERSSTANPPAGGRHRAPSPDPRRPYKAVAAAVVAALAVLIGQGQDLLPPWVLLVLAAASAGLATFLVPNPSRDTGE